MFCPHCGRQIEDGSRFCGACGKPLAAATSHIQQVSGNGNSRGVKVTTRTRKKNRVLIPVICILAVVIAAAAVLFLLTRKQTVYLVSKNSTTSSISTITNSFKYDQDGRLTKWKYDTEYLYDYYGDGTSHSITYHYDDEGLLERAVLKTPDESVAVDYTYRNGIMTGFEVDEDDLEGIEIDIECDDEGRFKSIVFSEDSEIYRTFEFNYYESGAIQEYSQTSDNTSKVIIRYNENGNAIESEYYHDDELVQKTVNEYDDKGHMTKQEQYATNNTDEPELIYSAEYVPVMDKKLMKEFLVIMKMPDENAEAEAELVFDCQWNGLSCEMTFREIRTDAQSLDILDLDESYLQDLSILFELDEAGNILSYGMTLNGENIQSGETEYIEFQAPRKYAKPRNNDPKYLQFLLGS